MTNTGSTTSFVDDREAIEAGTAVALAIARNELPQHEHITGSPNNVIKVAEWYIDLDHILDPSGEPCLVYSFGIGKYDPYTEFMANYCAVIAFDPSPNAKPPTHPNVTFYPYGLTTTTAARESHPHSNSNNTSSTTWSHPVYGPVDPTRLYTLPDLLHRLGHGDNTTIAALKFDCEGCEFGALRDILLADMGGTRIRTLHTEFHLSTTLGMRTTSDVARMSSVADFVRQRDCRVASFRPNRGFRRDRQVMSWLVDHGVPDGICCYEYTFVCGSDAAAESVSH